VFLRKEENKLACVSEKRREDWMDSLVLEKRRLDGQPRLREEEVNLRVSGRGGEVNLRVSGRGEKVNLRVSERRED